MSSDDALARPLDVTATPRPGVNLVGFLEGHLGLGEVARKLERALEHAGVPFVSIPYRGTPNAWLQSPRETPGEAPFDTNLVCLNADSLRAFAADLGVELFARRYSIGVWFWETDVFRREDLEALRFLDELWVASEYVRQAIADEADVPVEVAPLPIERPPRASLSRRDLGLPDGFTFLFNFDFVSAERKNPTAVLDAFTRAFSRGDEAVLVVKSVNGRERKPDRLAELEALAADRENVIVLDGYLPVERKDALVAACDCYVSLHRSEGFGLTMAEAMSYGKPVIATGYSGNLEYMTDDNSYLVPFRLTGVPSDWWAHSPGAEWAEPDIEAAATLMRRVWENPREARERGRRGREELLERFSVERAAAFVVGRLDDARARGAVRARLSPHDPRPPILEASRELWKGPGSSLVDEGGSALTSPIRRLLRRALWPHLRDQQRVERSVLDALTALQRSVDDLEQRVLQLEARTEDAVMRQS